MKSNASVAVKVSLQWLLPNEKCWKNSNVESLEKKKKIDSLNRQFNKPSSNMRDYNTLEKRILKISEHDAEVTSWLERILMDENVSALLQKEFSSSDSIDLSCESLFANCKVSFFFTPNIVSRAFKVSWPSREVVQDVLVGLLALFHLDPVFSLAQSSVL